ncbi:uncharacterized protein SCHCODRAFT_02572471 [Schizophyllum commune H4-8]|nr:uncharacterized protein SCHCODRAFT_02572471 [Schizophyllum commune H4-8]KAI5895209.1 hypothetical protein SCHCODRAFT_02572471 [Schizophyllum commune H4-8]
MGPERTQRGHISYLISEGQRGRNPGPSKELKKLREWGDLSHIADQRNLRAATSGSADQFAPIYLAPFYETHCALASPSKIILLIQTSGRQRPYSIVVEQLKYDPTFTSSRINAANLVSLEIRGGTTNIDARTREQLILLLRVMHPTRLISFHLHVPGRPAPGQEGTVYKFLRRAMNTLTHLCLELTFSDSKGLQAYLSSSAAAGLVCLELKTNITLQNPINHALQSKNSTRLPSLRLLCLNMDAEKVNLTTLLQALKKRYNGGLKHALRVELNFLPSTEEREEGRAINVTFDGPVTSRCSTFA